MRAIPKKIKEWGKWHDITDEKEAAKEWRRLNNRAKRERQKARRGK